MTDDQAPVPRRLLAAERTAALRRLGLLDQAPAADLDGLTRLAAIVTGQSRGILNLHDATRQVQASVSAGERGVFPREQSMCKLAVDTGAEVHVADASRDERFADNPFVDGTLASIRMYCGVPVRDTAGVVLGTLCVTDEEPRQLDDDELGALRDVAAQVEQLFELRRRNAQLVDALAEVDHYASRDALTGTPNRRTLLDRLDLALARSRRSGVPPTVIFCDLDGFKAVNDAHGHGAGDTVLVTVAHRLTAAMRPADTVARIGGDEFVLLCEGLPVHCRDTVVARVRQVVAEPIVLASGVTVAVGTSVGVAARGCDDALSALRAADELMYVDKRSRRLA